MKKHGFTLMELSIILVIIGLVIGGIMVGRELMVSARLRSVVNQQTAIQAAVANFATKYRCLPGDCATATSFGFTDSNGAACNGNGDGKLGLATGNITNIFSCNETGWEIVMFWPHLAQAGLVTKYTKGWTQTGYPYTAAPTEMNGNYFWVGYGSHTGWWAMSGIGHALGNLFALVGDARACGYWTCGGSSFSEGLYTYEAQDLDTKMDDGMPFTGRVHANAGNNNIDAMPVMGTGAPNNCVVGTAYASFSTNYNKRCALLIQMDAGMNSVN